MVQFGAYLADSQIPAFADGYVRYHDLKRIIKRFKKKSTNNEDAPASSDVASRDTPANSAADLEAPATATVGIRRRRPRVSTGSRARGGSASVPQDVRLLRVSATDDKSIPMNFGPMQQAANASEVERLLERATQGEGDEIDLRLMLPEEHLLDNPEVEREFCTAFQRELSRARKFFLTQQV
jgi:hypothetical protein